MNLEVLLIGLCKATFGLMIALTLIATVSRVLRRLLRWGDINQQVMQGNIAAGILHASSLIALALLVQHSVVATFTAMDILYRGAEVSLLMLETFAIYGVSHIVIALLVGALGLALGSWIFDFMTEDLQEMSEVRNGNIAAALVMSSVLIVLSILLSPGLSMMLDGLLPLPELGRDVFVTPS